jgi:hypothetical protein
MIAAAGAAEIQQLDGSNPYHEGSWSVDSEHLAESGCNLGRVVPCQNDMHGSIVENMKIFVED